MIATKLFDLHDHPFMIEASFIGQCHECEMGRHYPETGARR